MDFFIYFLGFYPGVSYFLFFKSIFKKGTEMKKTVLALVMIPFILLHLAGCVPVLIATGAMGGYAVSKDTFQGETDKNYDSLWSAALSVSRIRGNIKSEDSAKGYIELEAESSKVYIRLIRITQATTRIRVSARKYHLPNLTLAQDFFVKILEEAE
ncbi:MAG: DUF3568 family protein [Candidatus Omnitrophica bacterium]|nr:DUF3568 family protein [Candidatus Omnitrophota bacterium]